MATFLVSVVLAALAAPNALLAAAAENHEGKVVSAGDGKLVIADENGENQEFEVTAKTKITRNEKEAELDDLQEGDLVTIKSHRKGTSLVAIVIEATAPE